MIVGTAGHIDHGKTTLVRALTGVDTDRLPEEKQRGISIELGYAFLDTPDGQRIGFIDVPGHERLVHTMVAGASGIDYALLLVAADDGPMPQTREHLAVLALLGIARGAVVITKADRADAARIDAVRAEMQALLTGTPLAQAPVLAVSAHSGDGIEALRTLLFEADAQQPGARADDDALGFRLAIDRAFTLAGAGTVVTGTVHAGQLHAGEELALVPGSQQARARSLHAQNRPVASAHAGQRCAVALPGLAREDAARGQWLTHPAVALATDRLDARLMLWQGEARPLRSGARVLAHIGAAQVAASVAVLDTEVLAPGASALVQLVLHAPVGAWHGERVLLRDAAASRTLAGGRVLDPFAPTRYRRTPQRLAELAALELSGSAARLAALLAAAPQGVDLRRFARAQGLLQWPRSALPESALVNDGMALGAEQAEGFTAAALAALQAFHERQPDELGPDTARLRRLAAPRLPMPLWQGLVAPVGRTRPAGAARRLRAPALARRAAVGDRDPHRAESGAGAGPGRLRGRLGARPGARRGRARAAGAHHAGTTGATRRTAPDRQGPVLPARQHAAPGDDRARSRCGARRRRAGGGVSRCHRTGPQAGHPDSGILRPHRADAPHRRRAPIAQRLHAVFVDRRKGNHPGGWAGLQTRWVAPCVAGRVRLPCSSAPFAAERARTSPWKARAAACHEH